MPAVAADYTLGIFGNANMDDTIDEDDISYVEGIIDGTSEETQLADANYDGTIDEDDIAQIEQIIQGDEKELTIVDSADRIVTVKKPIERIVTTHSHHIETMRAIQLDMDKIVGVATWTLNMKLFFPEFSEEQNIGGSDYDIEKILRLQPDIVMIYTSTSHLINDFANKLESLGITVVYIDCYKHDNYIEEIRTLGYILNKKDEAEEFIDFYEEKVDIIKERVEGIREEDRPKVFLLRSSEGYKTLGGGSSYIYDIEMAGGNTIFGDNPDNNIEVDPEAVIDRDPDIILIHISPFGAYSTTDIAELSNLRDEIMNRQELANVTAVKNGDVYVLGSYFLGKPSRFVGLAYMGKWFYPELFEDLDPVAIHQEYLDKFHKTLNLDVYKDAVFVYPPLEVS